MNDYYPTFAWLKLSDDAAHGLEYPRWSGNTTRRPQSCLKTLVFSLIPVIALLLWAFLFKKKRYFTEHLIVATHFWSFALILIGVFIPILLLLLTRLGALLGVPPSIATADSVPTIIIQVVFAVYLFVMLRRVYFVSHWYGGLLAASIAWSFFHIVWLFRFLLFVVTLSHSNDHARGAEGRSRATATRSSLHAGQLAPRIRVSASAAMTSVLKRRCRLAREYCNLFSRVRS